VYGQTDLTRFIFSILGAGGGRGGGGGGGGVGEGRGYSGGDDDQFTDGVYTKGTRAHTHRELIREWLWEPKRSSIEYI